MKKSILKITLALLASLAAPQIFAQTIISKWYGIGGRAEEIPTRIRTIDNSILAVGHGKIGRGADSDLMLRSIDPAGNTQFLLLDSLPDNQVGYDVCAADGGNFIVCGAETTVSESRACLWRVSPTGAILEKKLFEKVDSFTAIVRTSAGGFAVAGRGRDSTSTTKGVVFFHFPSFDWQVFQKSFAKINGHSIIPNLILEMPQDSNLLVLGNYDSQGTFAHFIKFKRSGEVVFQKTSNFSSIRNQHLQIDEQGRWFLFYETVFGWHLRIFFDDGSTFKDISLPESSDASSVIIEKLTTDSLVAASVRFGVLDYEFSKWTINLIDFLVLKTLSLGLPFPPNFEPPQKFTFAPSGWGKTIAFSFFKNEFEQLRYELGSFNPASNQFKFDWRKKIGDSKPAGNLFVEDFAETPNCYFWVVNSQYSLLTNNHFLKTDRSGEPLFPLKSNVLELPRLIGGNSNNQFYARKKVLADKRGGAVVVTQDSVLNTLLAFFDKNGNEIREITLENSGFTSELPPALITSKNRILIFVEETSASSFGGKAFLHEMDGSLVAIRRWEKPNAFRGYWLCETADEKIAIMPSAPTDRFTILKYNFYDDEVDSLPVFIPNNIPTNFGNPQGEIRATEDGGFLIIRKISASFQIEKISKTGELQFYYNQDFNWDQRRLLIEELPGRGFVINSLAKTWQNGLLLDQTFLDKKGDTIATNQVTGLTADKFSNPNFLPGYTFRGWFTGARGGDLGFNFLTIHFPDDRPTDDPTRLFIFPNPAEKLQFQLRSEQVGEVQVEVFAVDGRRVFFKNFQKTVETEAFFAELPQLSAGIYFVSARLGGDVFSGRWVKN